MSTSSNFKHLANGLNLVPNTTTLIAEPGDIDYSTNTGEFNFYLAGGPDVLVTANSTQTLTNKTLHVGPSGPNYIIGPTPGTAAQFDVSTGYLDSSITTSVELGYVHGVTSNIQTQLNALQPLITILPVANGGTGADTFHPYSVIFSGTTSTGAFSDSGGPGTATYVLTSNGPGFYPSWQPASGGGGSGTVTSVAMSVPSFLSVSGSPITTSGTLNVIYSGTALPIANGGTNATSAASAYNNLSPMTTTGDMIYESSTGVAARLPIGSTGQVLTVVSGLPAWAAAGAGSSAVYYSGYMSNSSSWSTTSNTLVDPTNSGGNTLTTRQSSGLSVTAASSNLPGITFSPSSNTAAYLITAVVGLTNGTGGGANSTISLTDGTTVIQQADQGPTNISNRITLNGLYYPGTTSSVTVKIQLATSSSTSVIEAQTTIAPAIEWVITQVESAGGGGSGANTALSNLATTAINADLLPGTTNTIHLGSATDLFNNLYTSNITGPITSTMTIQTQATASTNSGALTVISGSTTTAGTGSVTVASGSSSSGGATGNASLYSGSTSSSSVTTGAALLQTGNNTSGSSGQVELTTGFASGSGKSSGNIQLTPGTAISGATQGQILLNAATTIGASSTTLTHSLNTNTAAPATGSGTFTNLPAGYSGNPTGYIQININGTVHVIPYW